MFQICRRTVYDSILPFFSRVVVFRRVLMLNANNSILSMPIPNSFADRIRRQAIVLDIGGFRPLDDPKTSWFGRAEWCAPDEAWPEFEGLPLRPLAQINLTQMPFRPPRLEDLAFLTVFIHPEDLP